MESNVLLLGALEPDKEAPYRAGPLGLCSGWQAAAQTETAIGMGVYI